ncbi:DnaB-like helicase C-terminal domain-containing protein [Streptomyces coeruleorubidus]|uniref:DnaB-like helicase C-terminal domain-containing protein n=1 Tax=Streptomyces coeruleorubidus TaxID=116188 RepID=UPI0033A18E90
MSTDIDVWGPDEATMPVPAGNVEAEKILAATAMADPGCVDDLAAGGFDPADIGDERYRMVWYAVEELASTLSASAIRWQAVAHKLQQWKAEGRMVARPLTETELGELYVSAHPGAAEYWASEVTRAAVASRTAALGVNMRVRASNPAFDPDTDVAAIQAEVDNLVRPAGQSQMVDLGDLLPDVLVRATTPPTNEDRVPTGVIDLDALLSGGFAPGQMVVIAARPAMGKTTIAAGFARAAAITNKIPSAIFSLEMGRDELATSILCGEVKIALHHVKQGIVEDAIVARAAAKLPELASAPLKIDDNPYLTLPGLRASIRNLVRTFGLKIVFIDYLQLMQAPPAESRQVAVSMISRNLKLMAKEFGITIVVLAQLNRGPEQRQDKVPMVSDLRESGSIEQDADMVILLHRPDMYERESPRAGEADLIVGKHRGGPMSTVTVAFQGHFARFVDMAAT